MAKFKKLRAALLRDPVVLTSYRYAARGRQAIQSSVRCAPGDLKATLSDREVRKSLMLRESPFEDNERNSTDIASIGGV